MAEISFKVFLTRENPDSEKKTEIRRFVIDADVVTNYTYLHEKLQTVFPELRGQRFSIKWKDSENDDIMISSCEELQIALTEMQNDPICKLYATLHSEYENAKSAFQADSARAATGPANKEKHVGILCDVCDKDIFGFGYKCLRCVDYDLCTKCEAKGFHPEHCMIRFPTPHQRKLYKGKCPFRPTDFKAVTSPTEEEPKKHTHKHGRHIGGPNFYQNPQLNSWLNTLSTYLINDPLESRINVNQQAPAQKPAKVKIAQAEKPAESRIVNQPVPAEKPAQIRIVQAEKPAASSIQPDNVSSSKQEAVQQNIKVDPKPTAPLQEIAVSSNQQKPSQDSSVTSLASDGSAASASYKDDWTLLDSDIPLADAATNATFDVEKTVPEVPTVSNGKQSMYPSLPNISDNVWHSDPKIQHAVDAMIQMGFNNEGGWLTQLLLLKNGDISKVLDILQPVNPKNRG